MRSLALVVRPGALGSDLVKAHVKGYTRKDGSFVKEHDDKRQKKAEQKGAGEAYSHPHAVGKAEITDPHCEGFGDCSGIKFAGTQYMSTGKTGKSFHDETPVREFESEDGHRIWLDDHGRVHADDVSEVDRLRKKHEAGPAKKPDKAAGGGDAASGAREGADAPDGPEKGPDGDKMPDFESMADDQLKELAAAAQAELKKRGGGDLAKSDATGDRIDGRGPEHEDQQDDEDPGKDPKAKKRKGYGTLTKALADGVRFILGNRHD